jgi:hypothetical protein
MSEGNQNRTFRLAIIAVVLMVGVGLLTMRWSEKPQDLANTLQERVPAPAEDAVPKPVLTVHPAAVEFAKKLTTRAESAEEDLQTVQQLLLVYQRAFGQNPEGDNEDVVAALLGQNKHGVAFLPEGVEGIHDGHLLDRWGTPYFMHPESSHHMSLRSAGPDRSLFTDDDVVLE